MRKIQAALIICTALYFFAIAAIYIDSYPIFLKKADTAIVFGNKVHENGHPSKRLQARLDVAIKLLNSNSVNNVIVSGGLGKEGHDEALVMANYLISKGIPKQLITVDSLGNNTSKTSHNAMKILGKTAKVVAVTQQYHISRSKLSLKNAGFSKVYGAFPKYYEIRDVYSSFREVLAWIKYCVSGN